MIMVKIKIGAGGWSYFNVPGDRLSRYSKIYDFVEVNSTFYFYPPIRMVKSWNKRVGPDFNFTVRCHRDLSHKHHLEPSEEAFKIFDKMMIICKILNAKALHVQTPSSYKPTDNIRQLSDFFSSISYTIPLALEIRNRDEPTQDLKSLMQDFKIIHCVDLSKGQRPFYTNEVLYTRLFGRGFKNIYQYDDEELENILLETQSSGSKSAFLNFHGVRMYTDAARMKIFKETENFPQLTKSTGVNSLIEVLKEDVVFPTTKNRLVEEQGWKVYDHNKNQHIHAWIPLSKIPSKTYDSVNDLVEELKKNWS
jgi:uncharacterized protein YecE (DUF72 family)